jgi:hypothetical protein
MLNPPAGARWRVVVSMVTDDGGEEVSYDRTGVAYTVAVATIQGTRIIGDVDHEGDPHLRHRLAAYIHTSVNDPPTTR